LRLFQQLSLYGRLILPFSLDFLFIKRGILNVLIQGIATKIGDVAKVLGLDRQRNLRNIRDGGGSCHLDGLVQKTIELDNVPGWCVFQSFVLIH
jgi:hypothetical protein